MSKKLFAAFMTIAAFAAFAMASTASAAPVITHPTGSVLTAGGTLIKGINTGETVMTSSLGNVTCSLSEITGTLDSNSTASGVKGTITSATFQGTGTTATNGDKECTSWTGGVTVTPGVSGGLPWCLEATEAKDEGKIRGGACSEPSRSIKYALDFTSIGTCNYVRENAAVGSLVTDTTGQAAQVSLASQEWLAAAGNPFGCPSSGKLDMTFNLTSGGSAVYFSS